MLKVGDKVLILTDAQAWKQFPWASLSAATQRWSGVTGVVRELDKSWRGIPCVSVYLDGNQREWDYMPVTALAPASSAKFHNKEVFTHSPWNQEKKVRGTARATSYGTGGSTSPYAYKVRLPEEGDVTHWRPRHASELVLVDEDAVMPLDGKRAKVKPERARAGRVGTLRDPKPYNGPRHLLPFPYYLAFDTGGGLLVTTDEFDVIDETVTYAKEDAKNTVEAAKPSGWSFSATRESIDVERIGREAKEAGFDWVEISLNGKTSGVSVTEEILSDMERYAGKILRKSETGQAGYVAVADTREDFEKLRAAYLKAKNKKYQFKVEGGKM